MIYQKFSKKQLLALSWWSLPKYQDYDFIICDGSVRSGKTLSMAIGFVLWSMGRFTGCSFALCGKTIESLRRNMTSDLPGWLAGLFEIKERRSENLLIISRGGRTNRYYLFGGKDEGSASLIQGMTLAGVLFDEAALMPKSFIEQALARCSVEGSRCWFNCNPSHPYHWFYQEWICKAEEKNTLRLHFTMEDNLSLSAKKREQYQRLYTGVFYDRYILGLWVMAEGLIYPAAAAGEGIVPAEERAYTQYHVSVDYGTLNPLSMGLWGYSGGVWYRFREFYHDGRQKGQKTDEEYYLDLEELCGDLPIRSILIDPSAASFIACIRKHGRYAVRQADNDVLNGIRRTAAALRDHKIAVCDNCTATIAEFKAYRWDEASAEDRPKKEHDHAMDDIRYFVNTVLYGNKGWGTSRAKYL